MLWLIGKIAEELVYVDGGMLDVIDVISALFLCIAEQEHVHMSKLER